MQRGILFIGLSLAAFALWPSVARACGAKPAPKPCYDYVCTGEGVWEPVRVACGPVGSFTLSAPLNGATGVAASQVFSWSSASNATGYVVAIGLAGQTTPLVTYSTAATSYLAPAGTMQAGTQYWWKITASNLDGQGVAGPSTFTTGVSPVAALDWSMPARYGSTKVNGVIVPQGVYDPVQVILDACASKPGFEKITSYDFVTTLSTQHTVVSSCSFTLSVSPNAQFTATVTAKDSVGRVSSSSKAVYARDYLIVAMGDSYASGEGNPDVPVVGLLPPRWQDAGCHRSANAPASLAALELEARSNKSTVTFWSEACSGKTTGDLVSTQIPAMQGRLAPPSGTPQRTPDMVVVGVGGNDVNFAGVMIWCTAYDCPTPWTESVVRDVGRAQLPGLLDQAIAAVRSQLPLRSDTKIVLTEYPDPTRNAANEWCSFLCLNSGFPDVCIHPSESRWLSQTYGMTLDQVVISAAARNHISYARGPWDEFIGHGTCSTPAWIHTLDSSKDSQGCDETLASSSFCSGIQGACNIVSPFLPCVSKGVEHPNVSGANSIAKAILRSWDESGGLAGYDSVLGRPVCSEASAVCSTGPTLIAGQGSTEPNGPNSPGFVGASSAVGSVEQITVSSLDGQDFSAGRRVGVDFTVTVSGSGSITVYSHSRAIDRTLSNSPAVVVATITPVTTGRLSYHVEFTLPDGNLQAVRVVTHDTTGAAIDADDLAFFVQGSPTECPGSYLQCGQTCTMGDTDAQNCGACGVACPSHDGLTGYCDGGVCRWVGCTSGFCCEQNADGSCAVCRPPNGSCP